MIEGRKKENLRFDTILKKITPYDIYKYFCPVPFKLNVRFSSPMPGRKDSDPSFIIGMKGSTLHHNDFADSRYRGDCFDFVQQIRMLPSIKDALLTIDKEFGLGISSEAVQAPKIITYEQPLIIEKIPPLIQVLPKAFTQEELRYWNDFHQDISDLKRENIYSIDQLFMDKKRMYVNPNELTFGYLQGDKWKIYRPFADKDNKWFPNNIKNDTCEGLENIPMCDKAIVAKSRKDRMVLLKVYPYVCSVQNESRQAFSEELVGHLKYCALYTYIAFDSDAAGKKNSMIVTNDLGYYHVNTPDLLLPEIKDFAAMGKEKGLKAIEDHLKLKNII